MIKRIRDFIYDINDIFIALLIVLIAAGIIVWRSSSIMKYPEYLAARQANAANEVIVPDNTVPENNVPSNQTDNTVDPNQNAVTPPANDVTPAENSVTPPANDVTPADNTVTPEKQTGDVIKASITIAKGAKGGWYAIADNIISAGLIKAEDKTAFINKVNELGLATKAQVGTFELSSDMTFEQMIKKLCRVKD